MMKRIAPLAAALMFCGVPIHAGPPAVETSPNGTTRIDDSAPDAGVVRR